MKVQIHLVYEVHDTIGAVCMMPTLGNHLQPQVPPLNIRPDPGAARVDSPVRGQSTRCPSFDKRLETPTERRPSTHIRKDVDKGEGPRGRLIYEVKGRASQPGEPEVQSTGPGWPFSEAPEYAAVGIRLQALPDRLGTVLPNSA